MTRRTSQPITSEILDRPPPAEVELERALLSAVLLDPTRLDFVMITLTAADFHNPANAKLYDALVTLHDAGNPINDPKTLIPELRRLSVSEADWSVPDLTRLYRDGIAHNAGHYATKILEAAALRRQLDVAKETIRRIYEPNADFAEIARWQDAQLDVITGKHQSRSRTIGEVAIDVLEDLDESGKSPRRGLMTGLHLVDESMGVMMPGEMIVEAARPGIGKTSLAMQWGLYQSLRERRVLFVSLEMGEKDLTQRTMCSLAKVDERRVRNGTVTHTERKALIEAAAALKNLPLEIWDPHSATAADIRAKARLHAKTGGLALLIVDYIGLVKPADPKRPRYEQVSAVSAAMKSLAKELDVPVLVLCQLNREAEKQRPSLANLRESGAIEQDADIVLFLHRTDKTKSETEFIVAKHRHGETGVLLLDFIREETRFVDPNEPLRA